LEWKFLDEHAVPDNRHCFGMSIPSQKTGVAVRDAVKALTGFRNRDVQLHSMCLFRRATTTWLSIPILGLTFLLSMAGVAYAQTHSAESNIIEVDTVSPVLNAVVIVSNNANSNSLAKAGDTVTVSITADMDIQQPVATWTVGGTTASDGTVSYSDLGDANGATWTASIDLGVGDTDGAVAFSIYYQGANGNTGLSVVATTNGSAVTFDNTAPTSFTTGAVTVAGGTVVSGVWNNESSGVSVEVPIPSDTSLLNGTVQLQGKAGAGAWEDMGSAVGISSVGVDQTLVLTAGEFEGLSGFAGGETIQVRALLTDAVGNTIAGTSSTTVISVSGGSSYTHSAESNIIEVDTASPVLNAVAIVSNNANSTSLAKAGDTVTVSITADMDIQQPVATWTVGGTTASDGTVSYSELGDANGANRPGRRGHGRCGGLLDRLPGNKRQHWIECRCDNQRQCGDF
jgi:hypothetical protein